MTSPVSVDSISHDLVRIGVCRGDLVMVHASLRAVGAVVGGGVEASGVIDALERAVGPDGTLLMNIGVRDDWSWVNERQATERPGLLRDAVPFDHLVTPADPDNGVLAEVFRARCGTVTSNHPEGRFAARGPLADTLLDDVPWDDYYGAGSPLERFVGLGGRVLRLGAGIDTVTLIHYAEHLVILPSKRRVRRHRLVTTGEGPVIRVVETLDDSAGIIDLPEGAPDYFGQILQAYLGTGSGRTGRVGNAPSELIDGADLVSFAVDWMATNL